MMRSRLALPALACLALIGCGGEPAPKLVAVTGKVSHKGQPLTAGNIFFHPADGGAGTPESPSSQLQLDGSFTIVSVPYGDGARPGKYKVTLSPALADRIRKPEYGDRNRTPWVVDVPENGLADKVLEVK